MGFFERSLNEIHKMSGQVKATSTTSLVEYVQKLEELEDQREKLADCAKELKKAAVTDGVISAKKLSKLLAARKRVRDLGPEGFDEELEFISECKIRRLI